MGFFNFLDSNDDDRPDVKGIFRFLKTTNPFTAPQTLLTETKKGRELSKDIAQGTARIPEKYGRSAAQVGLDIGAKIKGEEARDFSLTPTDPIRKFLYGEEELKTYQKAAEGNKARLEESRFRNIATPLAFLGAAGSVGLDVAPTPFGKGGKGINALIKADTPGAVKKILKDAPDDVALAISKTKDPNIIENLVTGNRPTRPAPPPLPIDEIPIAPVSAILPEEQGRAAQIGITSFRGQPVSTVAETKPFYDTEPFQVFEKSLVDEAPKHNIKIDNFNRSAGVWEGSIEPSYKIDVTGDLPNIRQYAASRGKQGDQDAVMVAIPDEKGVGTLYELPGIADSDLALKQLHDAGISGATVVDDTIYIGDVDNSLKNAILDSSKKLGIKAKAEKANIEFIERDSYDNIIQENQSQNILDTPETKTTATSQVESAPQVGKTDPKPKQRQRAFLDTVKKSDTEQPKAKQAAEAVKPQTYIQSPNPALVARAQKIIDEDYEGAIKRVTSKTANVETLDEDVAIGQLLVQKALKEDRAEDAVNLIDAIDRRGNATGRGSQALSIWGRLTPEGILKVATQKVRKAREAIKEGRKNDDADALAKEIKDSVENSVKVDKGDVDKTITSILDDIDADEAPSVAEQVAKRVSSQLTPKKKKKVDTLVAELSKKIKEERLAPLPKAQKRSATDILRDVFSRNQEARDVYPEVQAILRSKFADDPDTLKKLDKFFETEGGLPPSISTVNSAIKEQLTKDGVKIRDVIFKSWDNQKRSVDDVAKALVKEGFDPKSAKSLADEVVYRLNLRLGDAKTIELRRMMEDAPEVVQPTLIDKINKLSNLGALDDKDYLSLARTKLKLPELTPEITKELSALSQKLQGLPDGPEKNEVIGDIINKINEAIPATAGEKFTAYRYQNILSSPRSQLRNSVSNILNTMLTRPATIAVKASQDWIGAALTGKQKEHYFRDIPDYYRGMSNSMLDAVEAMKGAWSGKLTVQQLDLSDVSKGRMNQIPKKYTVVARMMEAQDRFLQTLVASGEYAVYKSKGVADDVARDKAEQVARYSLFRNPTDAKNLTGQGALLSKIDQFTDAMQQGMGKVPALRWFVPFVSTPMNITKQFIEFSPLGFSTLYKATGDRRAEQTAKALIGTTISLIGAKMALDGNTTWAVPKNEKEKEAFYAAGKKPYSIKIGDKWVPMIMFGPFAYALALPASVKDANDRAPLDASQMEKLTTALGGQAKFFTGQTYVQGMSDFIDVISGQSEGTAQTALAGIASQAIPLEGLKKYVTTVLDPVYRKKSTFADAFRGSTPIASKKLEPYTEPDTGEESRRNISDFVLPYSYGQAKGDSATKQQKKAVSEFYKIQSRSSSVRSKANDKINEAIKAGNSAEARRIAAEYNKKYAESFKEWKERYGDNSNSELVKEYNSRKIRLTSSRIKARRRTISRNIKKQSIYTAVRGG
jgi:hypothetical protein